MEACRTSFETLKKSFTTTPVLTHWIPRSPLIFETDASNYALAAILSTISPTDNDIHPIAFHSRTFSPPELNYDVHDKELLAIFEAFKTWRHYLEGSLDPIDVVTDHKNLEYFSTTKLLTRCQVWWSEYLSQFNLVIRFRPGRLGAKPDTLTRRWDVYPKEGGSDYATINPHNLRPVFTTEQLITSLRAMSLYAPVIRAAMIMDVDQLYNDIRSSLRDDPTASARLDNLTDRWTVTTDRLLLFDKCIYVPDANDLRLRVLQDKHDHPISGHFGQNRTLELIRREYVWSELRDAVKSYVKSCTTCMCSKSQRHRPYGLLKQLPIPERPWNSISMDFIEKLPPSTGYDTILVIIDRLTKQSVFIPTFDTITAPILAKLFVLHVFSKHGVPLHVTSDRGSEFVSSFFRSLRKALDMKLHFTSGYHPKGDRQTKCMNQTLEQYLRVYCNYQQDNWSDLFPIAKFAYNNTPNDMTGISPSLQVKDTIQTSPYTPNKTLPLQEHVTSL